MHALTPTGAGAGARAATKGEAAGAWAAARLVPRVTLVSFAHGEPYESALRRLNASARRAGFSRTLLWTLAELQRDPIVTRQPREFEALMREAASEAVPIRRPLCDVFKHVLLLRAMHDAADGEWMMWVDSSRYFSDPLQGADVRAAITAMTTPGRTPPPALASSPWSRLAPAQRAALSRPRLRLESVFGIVACPTDCTRERLCMPNGEARLFSPLTLRAFDQLLAQGRRAFLAQPHVLAANLLLRNTQYNRKLVLDWLQLALSEPRAFCASHPQDQSVWSMLAYNRSLPLVNLCPFLDVPFAKSKRVRHSLNPRRDCHTFSKNATGLLRALAEGKYSVLPSSSRLRSCELADYLPATTSTPTGTNKW